VTLQRLAHNLAHVNDDIVRRAVENLDVVDRFVPSRENEAREYRARMRRNTGSRDLAHRSETQRVVGVAGASQATDSVCSGVIGTSALGRGCVKGAGFGGSGLMELRFRAGTADRPQSMSAGACRRQRLLGTECRCELSEPRQHQRGVPSKDRAPFSRGFETVGRVRMRRRRPFSHPIERRRSMTPQA
jgi:hypothetical protein